MHHAQHPGLPPFPYQLPIGANPAIFIGQPPQHYHSHMTPEPCRNCPGCMAPGSAVPMNYGQAMPPPPNHHHHHPQQVPQAQNPSGPNGTFNHRAGAWNHGMIGPYSTRGPQNWR